jgi:hypothetical protein
MIEVQTNDTACRAGVANFVFLDRSGASTRAAFILDDDQPVEVTFRQHTGRMSFDVPLTPGTHRCTVKIDAFFTPAPGETMNRLYNVAMNIDGAHVADASGAIAPDDVADSGLGSFTVTAA